jgi:hypothetical protein
MLLAIPSAINHGSIDNTADEIEHHRRIPDPHSFRSEYRVID